MSFSGNYQYTAEEILEQGKGQRCNIFKQNRRKSNNYKWKESKRPITESKNLLTVESLFL